MSSAFLALWNDYPATLTEEYETWHTHEHVPERLTTPGMIWARRYGDFGQPNNRYFTLYALENLGTLEQTAYLDLVRQPTDWSHSMRRHFLNVLRIPASDFSECSKGVGGCMLVQAYSVQEAIAHDGAELLSGVLRHFLSTGRILGFRIGLAKPNQPYEVFEQTDVTEAGTLNIVVMIDGTTREALDHIHREVTDAATEALKPQRCLRDGLFDLLVNYQGCEFADNREAVTASPELRSRFAPSAPSPSTGWLVSSSDR